MINRRLLENFIICLRWSDMSKRYRRVIIAKFWSIIFCIFKRFYIHQTLRGKMINAYEICKCFNCHHQTSQFDAQNACSYSSSCLPRILECRIVRISRSHDPVLLSYEAIKNGTTNLWPWKQPEPVLPGTRLVKDPLCHLLHRERLVYAEFVDWWARAFIEVSICKYVYLMVPRL